MIKPIWMHKDFRYPPSSAEAIEARAKCVPGPDYAPNRIAALEDRIRSLEDRIRSLERALTEKPL